MTAIDTHETPLDYAPADADTWAHWHTPDERRAALVVDRPEPEGFEAHVRRDIFTYDRLGTFPTLDAALAALNAHEPTRARFGRLVLA